VLLPFDFAAGLFISATMAELKNRTNFAQQLKMLRIRRKLRISRYGRNCTW
jgi:hypothetical protein